jgi:hypothetical protein
MYAQIIPARTCCAKSGTSIFITTKAIIERRDTTLIRESVDDIKDGFIV